MNSDLKIQDLGETARTDSLGRDLFSQALSRHGQKLERGETATLQINVGLLCNQSCRHCHVSAGPQRKEIMDSETVEAVIAYARRNRFNSVDITGGAPELNPHITRLIEGLSPLTSRLMVRSNLTVLNGIEMEALTALFIKHRVILMASFPSLNEEQTDSQRGPGTFKTSLNVLRKLNSLGYGQTDSGLELHLVSNPNGAFLHSSQMQMEKRFREILGRKWGIVFNRLLSLANVPLGRYRQWLTASGTLEQYMAKLSSAFNACALEGLMCKTLVSVSWEGILYDCDFNSAAGLYLGGRRIHVSEMAGLPAPGTAIAVSDYCLTCAAGAGFT